MKNISRRNFIKTCWVLLAGIVALPFFKFGTQRSNTRGRPVKARFGRKLAG